jgi:hypothetical protein
MREVATNAIMSVIPIILKMCYQTYEGLKNIAITQYELIQSFIGIADVMA